jgi:uncharacterized membrane protein YcaP (DUF421 family)
MYFFVWLLLRIAGKRTLSETTVFDFVLLLILAETTQQALIGEDFSITNAVVLAITLVGLDILVSLLKQQFPRLDRIVDGQATVIVDNGRLLRERMRLVRVDEGDILEAARRLRGLERLDQIKYAILEQSGGISIIPK